MIDAPQTSSGKRPRIVILGGGFGGFEAAKALKHAAADIVLIDRTNHYLFQPLLYQVATAVLSPTDIASPIRWLLRHQRNTNVILAEAQRVDVSRRIVHLDGDAELSYDYLVVATGARHSYFGRPDWETVAPGLKGLEDAREIRRRFLLAFERAERTTDESERAAAMTFVIVGGGPTGVELAGMLPEIARRSMCQDFRNIDTRQTHVILLEGGPRILPTYPEDLSKHAERDLRDLGVDVRTSALVTDITPEFVRVGDQTILTHTVFWAAGNEASPIGRSLGAPVDLAGRVLVNPDLSLPDHPEVFVCGDVASIENPKTGSLVPGVAPAAMQMGKCAGKNILHRMCGEPTVAFRYRNKGDLATIGRHKAIALIHGVRITGVLAWWFWLLVHIMYLAGFRNRVLVLMEWAFAYLTYERGARLITEHEWEEPSPAHVTAA